MKTIATLNCGCSVRTHSHRTARALVYLCEHHTRIVIPPELESA